VEVASLVRQAESAGIEVFLDRQGKARVRYAETHRERLAGLLARLRAQRNDVAALLRERQGVSAPPECPPLPPGVRLVRYTPKTPPVAIQPCSIVTNVDKFIRSYLRDLRFRLEHPEAYACTPMCEILAKLAEVGVELALDRSHSTGRRSADV